MRTLRLCRIPRLLLALAVTGAIGVRGVDAAEPAPAVKVLSSEIPAAQLPDPGVPIIIKARLANTRSLERMVKAVIVRDGRAVEVPLLKSYLNEKDVPTYEFQTTAPLVELTYKFVVYDGDRPAGASPQYMVRRPCLPTLELTDTAITGDSPREQLADTFRKATALGNEIEHYEHARKLLEDLQQLLGQ